MSVLFTFSNEDRKGAFLTAEEQHPLGLPAYIIEKDFWVTQTLYIIYNDIIPKLTGLASPPFIFKGGTSLSKCFKSINRMSEDIDLSFSFELLKHEPIEKKDDGRKKLLQLALALDETAKQFIRETLLPHLAEGLEKMDSRIEIVVESETPLNIAIYYPKELDESYYGKGVKPRVLLETGGRSDNNPTIKVSINHMLSECVEAFSVDQPFEVCALSPQRTMLEKIFGVHTNLTACKQQPKYARHLYDIIQLHNQNDKWCLDKELFLAHVLFSDIYYKTSELSCKTANEGPIKLIPDNEDMNSHYKQDWESMVDMFPGGQLPYSYEDLIGKITELQKIINNAFYNK
ncbi:nucleotidyl transferase AbiEii/AbiGii toxin family protein [Enterobacter sp. 120016]|uniref:nucleotidyl transferase AbiEii/AbiGii toxin family protein n=1 Tax=Enterobacter sp. 120016 TaxID=2834878 RepID=UPI001BCE02B8|nr:nucleotidyl transferase AbiEii/AbiGii toxin family protein [Enterobacter sp. 120016]MBS7441522.1 nucleotidyl transferase AbiEii/AbiGii toxin family protein [Enterobacter sp. 120016]